MERKSRIMRVCPALEATPFNLKGPENFKGNVVWISTRRAGENAETPRSGWSRPGSVKATSPIDAPSFLTEGRRESKKSDGALKCAFRKMKSESSHCR